jgi:hypothetical protein
MQSTRHIVEWHGERYTVEPLRSLSRVTALSPLWAIFHRSEFIGTLTYHPNETPAELEVRCLSWLSDLLEPPRPRPW